MVICYSGRSAPSARAIADEDNTIELNRGSEGSINWGRASANTSLNPDISNVTNKRLMRQLFKENDVPMPKLVTYHRQDIYGDDHIRFNEEFEYPLVGRPDYHSRKRGFWLCNNINDVRRAIQGTRRKKAATHFMEYVESEREYRVHIFKGKSIRISEKEFFIDENGKRDYKTIKPGEIPLRKVREAAKAAVSAVGLDFGAVDILARGDDNDEVFVLEINAAPGLGGTMPKLYADTFRRWLDGEWNEPA